MHIVEGKTCRWLDPNSAVHYELVRPGVYRVKDRRVFDFWAPWSMLRGTECVEWMNSNTLEIGVKQL